MEKLEDVLWMMYRYIDFRESSSDRPITEDLCTEIRKRQGLECIKRVL